MKKLIWVLVCVIGSFVVLAGEMELQFPKKVDPPVGLKRPESYPPGPEREAAQKRLDEWTAYCRVKFEARRKARKEKEYQKRLADPVEGPFLRELAKVTDADGREQVGRMPDWAQKHYQMLIQRAEATGRRSGPSQQLVEIVGGRSAEEYSEILEAVRAAVSFATTPMGRRSTFEQRVRWFRGAMRPGIPISDDQIRKLLSVEPMASLWTKND